MPDAFLNCPKLERCVLLLLLPLNFFASSHLIALFLSICQEFQPFFLAALSAAPPPPPPPPSDELLDPPPKPPFADEEEEEEMLLRETCLMSMANKRVVVPEVGPSALRPEQRSCDKGVCEA